SNCERCASESLYSQASSLSCDIGNGNSRGASIHIVELPDATYQGFPGPVILYPSIVSDTVED
ncbi:hypothetical protein STEG23_006077, partial [Scotinomys teguina]